jgi:signal transduction histidine kinase
VNRPLTTALGWRLPPWVLDYGPVALIAAEGIAAIALRPTGGMTRLSLVVALLVSASALIMRHRSPMVALAAVLGVALIVGWGPVVVLPVLFGLFTVAEYSDRRKVIGAAVVAAGVLIAIPPVHGGEESLSAILSRLVAVGLPVAAGLYVRARADYVSGLHDRAERLERERELLADQAVGEERVRIARELHDVVAHNVSLMVVQAQALAATSTGERDDATALQRVADLGREALSEMHRMLGLLRLQNGNAAERAPQPGVRDLRGLIDRTREAGVNTTLTVEGEISELPPGVDLSVYRIVQEALTNVIRHAQAGHAEVTLSYAPEALHVTVVDDGHGPALAYANGSPGHGLVGMRERVALFGGELETGRRAEGAGYRVHASLPVR